VRGFPNNLCQGLPRVHIDKVLIIPVDKVAGKVRKKAQIVGVAEDDAYKGWFAVVVGGELGGRRPGRAGRGGSGRARLVSVMVQLLTKRFRRPGRSQ
jgi:hypothetical protein